MSVIANLLISGALAVKCDKKIEECYAITAMVMAILLYIPGLYFSFYPGLFLCLCLLCVAICYIFVSLQRQKDAVRKSIFTAGGFFLIICIIFFAIYSIGRGIDTPDDFYFWNLRVKSFIYYNKIRGVPEREFGNHPPIISLWNYLTIKTSTGSVSQGLCLWGEDVLLLSFLSPLFTLIRGNKRKYKAVLLSLIVFFVPALTGETYHMLLTDFFLGVMLYFGIHSYVEFNLKKDNFYAFSFIVNAVALTMTKRIGTVILIIAFFVCLHVSKNKDERAKGCCLIIISGFLSSLFLLSWVGLSQYFYISLLGTLGCVFVYAALRFIEKKELNESYCIMAFLILIVLVGSVVMLWRFDKGGECLKHIWSLLITDPRIYFIEGVIDLFIVIAFLTKKGGAGYGFLNRINAAPMGAAYLTCTVSYMLLMWYLTATEIYPANGMGNGLSIRYFIPVLMPLLCAVISLVFCFDDREICILLMLSLLMVHAFSDTKSLYYNMFHKAEKIEFNEFARNNITLSSDDRVYFIDEYDGYGYTDRAFYNYVFPASTQFGRVKNTLEGGVGGPMDETLEEIKSNIAAGEYNYVYIQLISEETAIEYEGLFENVDDIGNGRLYAVDRDAHTDEIQLRWLNGV